MARVEIFIGADPVKWNLDTSSTTDPADPILTARVRELLRLLRTVPGVARL